MPATAKKPASVKDPASALAARQSATGETVRLRATRDGYYGVSGAAADIRKAGTVFAFAVKDLQPFKAGGEYHDGSPIECITIKGKDYALPSWCEDASKPADVEEEVDEITSAVTGDEDVI